MVVRACRCRNTRDIVDAIVACDGEAAEQAMQAHLRSVDDGLLNWVD